MGISQRFAAMQREVAQACVACGRNPDTVRLVAVSKTVDVAGAREAADAGALDFGENRPDRILEKSQAIPHARWHFIGNIQSRRIPDIVSSASLIHSLFQLRHAEKIDAAAASLGKVQDVLIEVNVSGEESKGGATVAEAPCLVRACSALEHVRVCGLMTMAPQGAPTIARDTFAGLARLHEDIRAELAPKDAEAFCELSMGMSDDWRCAIEQGATIVRIGRAIFSDSYQESV